MLCLFNRFAHSAGPSHWVAGCVCCLVSCVLSCRVSCCLVLSSFVLSCLVVSCPVLSCLVLSWLVLSCLVLVSSRPVLCCVGRPWATILHPQSGAVGPLGAPLGSPGASWGALSGQMGPGRRPEVLRMNLPRPFGEENGTPGAHVWVHFGTQSRISRREVNSQGGSKSAVVS